MVPYDFEIIEIHSIVAGVVQIDLDRFIVHFGRYKKFHCQFFPAFLSVNNFVLVVIEGVLDACHNNIAQLAARRRLTPHADTEAFAML